MILRGNWLAVKKYLVYRSEVDQVSDKTVRLEKTWLRHLLVWADDSHLSKTPKIRPTFPQYVISGRLDGSGDEFSQIYITKVIGTAKRFLDWLSRNRKGYRNIKSGYLETLKVPRMEAKPRKHESVTLDEIINISKAPIDSLRDERIQAAAVLWFLSGIRVGAFVTLPIKAVDLENRTIMLWPSLGVKTKFNQHNTAYLLEIPELLDVVIAWNNKVRKYLDLEAPWFAPFSPIIGGFDKDYKDVGKHRSDRARKDLRIWLEKVELPYHSPHKFRHGHAVYSLKQAITITDLKAISQNLNHASIKTTDQIYSILSEDDVRERIAGFGQGSLMKPDHNQDEKLHKIWKILNE